MKWQKNANQQEIQYPSVKDKIQKILSIRFYKILCKNKPKLYLIYTNPIVGVIIPRGKENF